MSSKRIISPLILLVIVNIGICGMAVATFCILLFKKNILMAIVPGLVALLGLLSQPWMILFLSLPFGFLVAPFIGTFLTVGIYRSLETRGHLLWLREVLEKIRSRHVISGFAGVACRRWMNAEIN